MKEKTRVSLQYGITLDELPQEVERLSSKITNRHFRELNNLITRASTCSGDDYVSNVYLDTISRIKQCVLDIDSVATDIESIVTGYLSMDDEVPEEQDNGVEEPVVPVTVTDQVSDNTREMIDQMRLFREKQALIENEQKPTTTTED